MRQASSPTKPTEATGRHKRSQSSVLKSIGLPRHRDTSSNVLQSPSKLRSPPPQRSSPSFASKKPQSPLGQVSANRGRSPTRRVMGAPENQDDKARMTRSRAKSGTTPEHAFGRFAASPSKQRADEAKDRGSLVKNKSSTGLSALFSKSKPSKADANGEAKQAKEKENQTPPNSAGIMPPPIWSEFSKQDGDGTPRTTKVPLNDSRAFGETQSRYRPSENSPTKGRDVFFDRPRLQSTTRQTRPTSFVGGSSFVTQHIEITKPRPKSYVQSSDAGEALPREDDFPSVSAAGSAQRYSDGNVGQGTGLTIAKRGSRVMAAVAAWNGKNKDGTNGSKEEKREDLNDPKQFESAFENMLESRNIAQDVRDKMRRLDTTMKASLIRQNQTSTPAAAGGPPGTPLSVSRPSTGNRAKTDGIPAASQPDDAKTPKKSRPRSLTFTLGKGSSSRSASQDRGASPFKKHKSSRSGSSHGRKKSTELSRSSSATSIASVASGVSPVPEDFITYLQATHQPQRVEVGRVQKLRQLLRNETVVWVDEFVDKGGMDEVVGLLYRIIDIEWREEHEDNLLHHTLTCLKALLTTSSALSRLSSFQGKLFPTLLNLLFSSGDEKKGPSEFATRDTLISLLLLYLSAAPTPERAEILLSHLRDPTPDEAARPPGFVLEMRRPRPYRRWCTEVTNVTKEVFWIFLHQLNVVPRPCDQDEFMYPGKAAAAELEERENRSYRARYFPAPRAPVPAAPYVGGVEWDATNYLATHLDLLNGLIACIAAPPSASQLPTPAAGISPTEVIDLDPPSSPASATGEAAAAAREARNALRRELRDSGFERVLGGALRTCKEKFYGAVHAGLRTWVAAAEADGWDTRCVREGPGRDDDHGSPRKARSPAKATPAPRLEVPGLGAAAAGAEKVEWL